MSNASHRLNFLISVVYFEDFFVLFSKDQTKAIVCIIHILRRNSSSNLLVMYVKGWKSELTVLTKVAQPAGNNGAKD